MHLEQNIDMSKNIVDILKGKIGGQAFLQILKLAFCVGSSSRVNMLWLLWQSIDDKQSTNICSSYK